LQVSLRNSVRQLVRTNII